MPKGFDAERYPAPRGKADAAPLDSEGIELWLGFEAEAMRYSLDPDVSRGYLAALIDASTVALDKIVFCCCSTSCSLCSWRSCPFLPPFSESTATTDSP
jgi:hypothetical protein